MGASNNVTAILNLGAMLCSIPIIWAGIWLASKPENECVQLFRWPVVILGVLVLVVSLVGFLGAYWHKESLLALYLFSMALLIGLLLILLVFAFLVTRPDGSYSLPGSSYTEFRLDGFSGWLRDRVSNPDNWNKIETCLANSDVCAKLPLNYNYVTADQFLAAHVSPLQWGCCKPPTACGYGYVNPTLWVNPANPGADMDCVMWSNEQRQLCYGCDSCKAGLLGNLRKEWRRANLILVIALVVLIWVYVIGCSAFKNAQIESLFRRNKHQHTPTPHLSLFLYILSSIPL